MHASKFCAFAAIAALSATAAMAAATDINIVDPQATHRAAHVEVGGRLAVEEVPPTSFFHAVLFGTTSTSGCVVVAQPPAGQALVVRQVRIDVFQDPTPGNGNYVQVSGDGTCSNPVGDVNPPTVGQSTMSFDPGVAIPAGGALSAVIGGAVQAEFYVDGYTVGAGVLPAAGQTIQVNGSAHRQR
jgi:hypothetical protein